MSQLHLVGVVVRIFALYIGLTTVQLAPSMIGAANAWKVEGWAVLLAVGALLVPLFAALLLWYFNLAIARRLFYRDAGEANLELAGVDQLESALFGLFGLWAICTALADGAYWFGFFQVASSPLWQDTTLSPEQSGSMASSAASFVLGVLILLKGRALNKALNKIRGRE